MHPLKRSAPSAALLAAAAGVSLLALAGPLQAQQDTRITRPIRMIVPYVPGGGTDTLARIVAPFVSEAFGQTVLVDNRPGASSTLGTQIVAQAVPDGHTIGMIDAAFLINPSLLGKLPYDTLKDFAPITTLGYFDLGLFVPAGSRFRSLAEVLAHARANPGRLNVGTVAPGSTQHLAAKLFETVAGIDMLVVPYRASPAVLSALRSGEIDLAFEIVGPMVPQVAGGVVRALAVTSGQPNPALPGVPTVQQAGLPGYDVASWNALAAPAGTPADVIEKINLAARAAIDSPAVRDKLGRLGMRLAGSTPAELQALLEGEIRRWGGVIRAAKIEPE